MESINVALESPTLSRMVTPMKPSDFLKNHWEKSKHLVLHGDVQRFYELPGISDVESLENVLAIYKNPVMVVGEAVIEETGGIADRFLVDVSEAREWYEKGAALEFDFSDMFLPQLRSWMGKLKNELQLPPGAGVKAIVYAAKNGGGFKAHFDAYTNFIFHLKGTKTWKLSENKNVVNPVQHYDLVEKPYIPEELSTYWQGEHPEDSLPEADIVNLVPGSFLYLPRGVWHSTSSSEATLSLNITFTHPVWAELLVAEIRSRLVKNEIWRELAVNINFLDEKSKQEVLHKLDTELKKISDNISSIKAEDILTRDSEDFDLYHITQAVFRQSLASKHMY
ncbi:cupin domain-containing protein [Paenibacillus wenxiniae]|uniref:Cupin domain-containing protein n=1 Tax=Paenibacillus wenxiniae TaxID=1636843 RepID=A0ABW4RRJ7_9BACL